MCAKLLSNFLPEGLREHLPMRVRLKLADKTREERQINGLIKRAEEIAGIGRIGGNFNPTRIDFSVFTNVMDNVETSMQEYEGPFKEYFGMRVERARDYVEAAFGN